MGITCTSQGYPILKWKPQISVRLKYIASHGHHMGITCTSQGYPILKWKPKISVRLKYIASHAHHMGITCTSQGYPILKWKPKISVRLKYIASHAHHIGITCTSQGYPILKWKPKISVRLRKMNTHIGLIFSSHEWNNFIGKQTKRMLPCHTGLVKLFCFAVWYGWSWQPGPVMPIILTGNLCVWRAKNDNFAPFFTILAHFGRALFQNWWATSES